MINIVTINLNNKQGLMKTMESVINQTRFDIINYIVIDGGSTDGSKEVIEQYADKLYYWTSEKDEGIYNAMNKGVDVLPNEGYCLFLNSGDYLFEKNTIETFLPYLCNFDIIYGDEYKLRNSGYMNLSKYNDILDEKFFKTTALPHQSSFIKCELMKANKYSEDYELLGDWKFFREMIMEKKVPYKHIPIAVSVYGLDGISSINRTQHNKEKEEYYRMKRI